MRNSLLYALLRVAAWVIPHLSVRLLYGLADAAGAAAYWALPSLRDVLEANYRQAFPNASAERLRDLSRGALRNDARNWLDTLRIPGIANSELQTMVRVENWEALEAAAAARRGAIIVTMHLGNFDLVGQVLAARGWKLTVPVERINPVRLFDFLVRTRASRGIDIVPLEQAPRAMLGALSRHELVGLAIDRHVAGKTIEVEYFGRPALFPRGFASLVRHAEVPVFLGVGVRVGNGHFRGIIRGPLAIEHHPGQETERRNIGLIVAEMEQLVRTYPDQWLAFWPVWQRDPEAKGPDKVVQPAEAPF